jgi:alanine racemase
MNMFAIDLTEVADARREDEVVLIGEQGRGQIFAEELAAPLGTINYEITSRISPLIPRVLC